MAPLDGLGRQETASPPARKVAPSPVPERRAAKWADVLAVIAAEMEQRESAQRAEQSLRGIGERMGRDTLVPLPQTRIEWEAAINRALAELDWGWVALVEREGMLFFEHRPPWPFEKNAKQLPFVLEGFYTDTMRRLARDLTKDARMVGKRGSALVFQWPLADTAPSRNGALSGAGWRGESPAPAAAAPPRAEHRGQGRSPSDIFAALNEMRTRMQPAAVAAPRPVVSEPPVRATPKPDEPLIFLPVAPMLAATAPTVLGPIATERRERIRAKSQARPAPVLLIGATVFALLFGLGLVSSKVDLPSDIFQSLLRYSGIVDDGSGSLARLEKFALNGDADAQIQLGLKLADPRAPEHDDARAAGWFRMAANGGSPEAQYDLAVMTERGLGIKPDDVEAAILYMNAAASGFPMAEYRIGAAYENGRGVSRSSPDAASWYERAARQGVREAQSGLARLYAAGNGVAADIGLAYAWGELAERGGDHDAATLRATLAIRMTPEQVTAARKQAEALFAEIGRAGPVSTRPTIDQVIDRRG